MSQDKETQSPQQPPIQNEKHRQSIKEREEIQEAERVEIAEAIFVRWKTRKLMKERDIEYQTAKTKAQSKWSKLSDDKIQKFYRIATIECHLLNEDGLSGKKKIGDISKRKEEYHPYLLFCKENREKVKEEGFTGNEIMKHLSELWKEMPEDKKKKYQDLALQNRNKNNNTNTTDLN
ncbi:hypothetical protein EIN_496710 [Entamoeba invadens IP1]|uniref:HMG box domain-containing protein n=1 Tax=Entamoeba invadens IP1 TaxID=370355 RepID=A0A0A1TZV0_ENTIV|nr:hypothetical protein EIN_496710 [Entamoeba invadens IP1]ELP87126.1 hypothetical protein EIN_496710 [Entamoeba invadens IP1]|eukprot:XP_004253897.1 hypothetical protein EIN_496710 [Entamoeba invadens IP1]